MAEFVITGKKGSGKNLYACHVIDSYLRQGRPVVTNMDLFLENYYSPSDSKFYYRIPDIPTIEILESLPVIDNGSDESKNGLIVFDECGSWLNSRDFSDKSRKGVLNWLIHSRKKGWDVYYIVQHIDMLDKQIRDGFAEHLIVVTRLDRMPIPILGSLLSFIGLALRFPRFHLARVYYGSSELGVLVNRVVFKGSAYYNFYDTRQVYNPFSNQLGISCSLPSSFHNRNLSSKQRFKFFLKRIAPVFTLLFYLFVLIFVFWFFLFRSSDFVTSPVSVSPDPDVAVIYDSFDGSGYILKGSSSSPIRVLRSNSGSLTIEGNDNEIFDFRFR